VEMRGYEPLSATASLASSTDLVHCCCCVKGALHKPFSHNPYLFLISDRHELRYVTLTELSPTPDHQ